MVLVPNGQRINNNNNMEHLYSSGSCTRPEAFHCGGLLLMVGTGGSLQGATHRATRRCSEISSNFVARPKLWLGEVLVQQCCVIKFSGE